jgi:hypothetical protein
MVSLFLPIRRLRFTTRRRLRFTTRRRLRFTTRRRLRFTTRRRRTRRRLTIRRSLFSTRRRLTRRLSFFLNCPRCTRRPLCLTRRPPLLSDILLASPFNLRRSVLQQFLTLFQRRPCFTRRVAPRIFFHFLPKRNKKPLPRRRSWLYLFRPLRMNQWYLRRTTG